MWTTSLKVAVGLIVAVVLAGVGIGVVALANDGGPTVRAAPWHLTEAPTDGRLPLVAVFGRSSCTDFKRWTVAETNASVEIRALVTYLDGDCTADEVQIARDAVLDRPLGERKLQGCEPSDEEADCRRIQRAT